MKRREEQCVAAFEGSATVTQPSLESDRRACEIAALKINLSIRINQSLSMKSLLRSQIEKWAPAFFHSIRAVRNRRYFQKEFSELHAEIRKELYPERQPIVVRCGPFRGLQYFDETVWGSITPKWIGSYEAELHPIIGEISRRSHSTIIDVGCAEGYYAVGLARIVPSARIIAFDTDFISRQQARRLAKLNGLEDRVKVGSFCAHQDLDALSKGLTLVVCDIEGFESHLLNPCCAKSLYRSDILVEVHEGSESPAATEQLLLTRFAKSHRIERIAATNRSSWIEDNLSSFPKSMGRETLERATEENRAAGRVWLWMQAEANRT